MRYCVNQSKGDYMDNSRIKLTIRKAIFDNILKHELLFKKNLWQDYMQVEVLRAFPKEYKQFFEETVNGLIVEGVLKTTNSPHLCVTEKGQDLIFSNDYYTVERLENTILEHLRDNNYFANSIWQRLTYVSYCDRELNAYQKFLFFKTIDSMIEEGIFTCDAEYNLKLTKLGQNKIFGIIE